MTEVNTTACNCMDIGTLIQEEDTVTELTIKAGSQQEAEARLVKLQTLAQSIESDPCTISTHITQTDLETSIQARFDFVCAAEKLIFDMRTASYR